MNEFRFRVLRECVRVNEDNSTSTTEKKNGNDANEWEEESEENYVNEGRKTLSR